MQPMKLTVSQPLVATVQSVDVRGGAPLPGLQYTRTNSLFQVKDDKLIFLKNKIPSIFLKRRKLGSHNNGKPHFLRNTDLTELSLVFSLLYLTCLETQLCQNTTYREINEWETETLLFVITER